MLKKYLSIILVIVIITLSLSFVFYTYIKRGSSKIYYAELVTLYNKFDMKKELESKLQSSVNLSNSLLDSIQFQLNSKFRQIQSTNSKDKTLLNEYQNLQEYYEKQKKELEEKTGNLSQSYDDQIWKQLNQYISDYGKSKGYDYIIGAQGTGTIMYATDKYNITEELIKYVNERFQGK